MGRRQVWRYAFLALVFSSFGAFAVGASAAVVSFQAISESSQSQQNVPVTFGQVFRDGDVPSGAHLRALWGDQSLPIQVDRKATNSDGSLRHAVVTVVVPELTATATKIITLDTGGQAATAPPVSLSSLLATSFDAKVSLNVNGQVMTADARTLLQQAHDNASCKPWGKQCNLWLSGPQVSEWIVGGPLQSASGASPHLAAYFYVRAYAGNPIHRVRVNVVIENDWTWVQNPHDITYDATITVGGQTVYQKAGIDHYAHTRWHHIAWWGDKADVYAKLNGQYIESTKAVPQYADDVHPTDAFLDTVRQSVEPMDHGDQTQHMGNAGAQAAIGPLPRWSVAYLQSTDRRAYLWMLANDDAAGSYDIFFRDQETGRPVSILDYPYMTILGTYRGTYDPTTGKYEAFPDCGDGVCDDPNLPNAAHEPSIGYLSYIVTGDFYYLEQLQFWADWNEFQMNPDYRGHTAGLLKPNQVRGQAWGMRTLGDAAYITPDNSPFKSYFVDMVHNNLDWYNNEYTNNPNANKLGAITTGCCATHYENHTSLAPWQDDFFTWAIGHLAGQGFTGAATFLRWKAKFVVNRMTEPDYCWLLASAYTLKVTDGVDSPIYDNLGQSYAAQWPNLVGLTCNSPEMLSAWGNGNYQAGEMYGFADSPTGYPANLQPALAVAVNSGIANSALAWQIFSDRSVKPDYTNDAMWAVVPRHAVASYQPRIELYADPNPVAPNGMTTLHWDAVGANSCSGTWMSGNATSGQQTIGPINGAHTYTIDCTGSGGTAEVSVRVADATVQPPTVTLAASPATIQAGQDSVLTWSTQYADSCTASGGWSGDVATSGQTTVGPLQGDADFAIDCRGAGGDVAKTVHVHVESTSVSDDPPPADDPPATADPQSDQTAKGGAGAFGIFGYLLLLGVALPFRRRRR
ncbi:MAG TPA: hypothetical protein VFM97_03075 [Gammaproteobacteria bacterium]|nr:hypothetical protein [Gammaproteobacteria bacterium]